MVDHAVMKIYCIIAIIDYHHYIYPKNFKDYVKKENNFMIATYV